MRWLLLPLLLGCSHVQSVQLPEQLPTEHHVQQDAIQQQHAITRSEADSMLKAIKAEERWHQLGNKLDHIENWQTADFSRMLNYTLWAAIVRMQHATTQEDFSRFRRVFDAAETLVLEWERTLKEMRAKGVDLQYGLGTEP